MELQTDNPYQAPSAPIQAMAVATPRPVLYAPVTWKFVLLSVCTFNFYLIIWFYRNWVGLRRAQQIKLSPVWRSIFSPFTAYSCFGRMEEVSAKRTGLRDLNFHAGILATIYFVLNAFGRLPEPFWVVALFACVPVLIVNAKVRAANLAAGDDVAIDDRLSWGAWILVALGVCCFALAMVGLVLSEPA